METNPLREIQKTQNQINKISKLGGRDSLFGLMGIFEIYLAEEHDKDDETGMYRFKGMEQYGNIVSIPRIYDTVQRCVEELNFTEEEFKKLINWYSGRNYGPDTKILALAIGWAITDKKYFH